MLFVVMAAFGQAPVLGTPTNTEVLYVVAEEGVQSKRFADDAEATHFTFANAAAVRVLFKEDGWVRVRQGANYGWVPEAALSAEAPAPPSLPVELTPTALPVVPQ